ncbi:hypothetical protein L0244_33280 [bacterium]|nr:hypothetical protein [bacterium]
MCHAREAGCRRIVESCHRERSEAIPTFENYEVGDCFASLAMTTTTFCDTLEGGHPKFRKKNGFPLSRK